MGDGVTVISDALFHSKIYTFFYISVSVTIVHVYTRLKNDTPISDISWEKILSLK